MGYLNLYYTPVFVVLTAGVVFLSYPLLQRAIVAIYDRARSIRQGGVSGVYAGAMTFLALLALYLLFLVTTGKGLLPGGGHDYYTHYFPYYLGRGEEPRHLAQRCMVSLLLLKGAGLIPELFLTTRSPRSLSPSCSLSFHAYICFPYQESRTIIIGPWWRSFFPCAFAWTPDAVSSKSSTYSWAH
jgi:hypothetical protein